MKLQKKYLEPILIALNYPIAKYVIARKRDKLRDELITVYKRYLKEKTDILNNLGLKDKDGKLVFDDNKNYTFTPKNKEKWDKEILVLIAEEVEFPTELTIGEIKSMIENSTVDFEPGTTAVLGELFDNLETNKQKKAKAGKA